MSLNWEEYAFLFDWELNAISSHQAQDYKAWLKLSQLYGGKILELGCGSGRIASKLMSQSINITALDSSKFLINKLRKEHPDFPAEKVILGDMLTYKFPEKYDFVFYSYSTWQYLLSLEEQIQALHHIHKYINNGGKIAFDICPYTCDLPLEQAKTLLYKKYNKELGKDVSMYTSHRVDRISQITTWEDSYVLEDKKGGRDVLHHTLSLKGNRGDFLELLLLHCGFRLIDAYGDFALNGVTPESDNIIYVAEKV
ncbi:MAG: class I SAM-dependent methyltransferase [Candidatus Cloacimonadales bacterium]